MQKLSRLDWPAGISYNCYGYTIGIRTNRAELLPAIRDSVPPGCVEIQRQDVNYLYSLKAAGQARPGVRQFHMLYSDIVRIARETELEEVFRTLRDDMETVFSAFSPERVFVHAGVVAWKGRAVIIPGRSESGKTTLTHALLNAGAAYMSDEFAVLDQDGMVHPYPRPMSVRREGLVYPERVPVETLGAPIQKEPLRAGAVLVAPYTEGGRWKPKAMTRGEAVLELMANAVPIRDKPKEVLQTLEKATEDIVALRSPRGEAKEVAADIWNRLPD